MNTSSHLPLHLKNSLLLQQFREFYKELIRQKETVLSGSASAPPEDAPDLLPPPPPESSAGDMVNIIQTKLMDILEKQVPASRRQGGEYGVTYYKEAQYVMAALADEVFLGIDWKGQDAWQNNLIEFRLFGTYNAGDKLFQKLEKHFKERDPAYAEIVCVYLLAFSLGFRGKYKGKDDGGKIDLYRRRIYGMVFQKSPDLASEKRRLFPAAYDPLITSGDRAELPYLKRRIWIFIGVLVLFLLASTFIWMNFSSDLFQAVDDLIRRFTGMAG